MRKFGTERGAGMDYTDHGRNFLENAWRIIKFNYEHSRAMTKMRNIVSGVVGFGTARDVLKSAYYKLGEDTAELTVNEVFPDKKNYAFVTGGGNGIMAAFNKGTRKAGGISVGLNIRLPMEQKPNKYSNLKVDFSYFSIRKTHLLMKADIAVLVLPGGNGTMDEFFETLTLMQTRRIPARPLILADKAFYWDAIEGLMELFERNKTISPIDRKLYQYANTAEEIIKAIHDWPEYYEKHLKHKFKHV